MASTPSGATRTQHTHDVIREQILRGARRPGSPLRIVELAKEFGTSMSVVREALIRLGEQHLVTSEPNIGFRVMGTSREDLIDLVDMRITLETLALRRSIEQGDVPWEVGVVAAHHALERTPMLREDGLGTTDEWSQAHAAFHDALGSACGSPRLLTFTRTMRDSAELYRQMSVDPHGPSRDVVAEHRELMDLAVARDADAAVAALTAHLQQTADAALAVEFPEDE